MRHLLVSQTCYISASHRERPTNSNFEKKNVSLLDLPKVAEMCLSRLPLPSGIQEVLSVGTIYYLSINPPLTSTSLTREIERARL